MKEVKKFNDVSLEIEKGGTGMHLEDVRHASRQPFRSFRFPVYRIFFASLLGQMAAMNMQIMARTLLVYRLTGSATILGAMAFAHATPMLLFSLFGGVIADRLQKKNIIFMGNVVFTIVSLGVALSLYLGYLSPARAGSWWILVVASIIQGTIMALVMPSRQSILPEIVGEEELMNATSLNVMAMNTLRLFAPALTGFLIDYIGFEAVYFTMTGLYAYSALLTCFIPPTRTLVRKTSGAIEDLKEGINYLRKETIILLLLSFTLASVVLGMPYHTLLPIITEDVLKVGATGMGILMSVSGVGAIIGSLILATLPNKKRGLMLLWSGIFLGLILAAFSFSSTWKLSLVLIAFVGLAQTARMALGNTLIQYYVDDNYRGRVMSITMMEFGLMSFGAFAAGLLTEGVGIQWALGSLSLALAFIYILGLIFVPRIRKLD